jgi:hypothetical protein
MGQGHYLSDSPEKTMSDRTKPRKRPRMKRVKGSGGGVVLHEDDLFITRLPEYRPKPVRKPR